MALPIATIPELTGEAAERFEAMAQRNYERKLYMTEEEKKEVAEVLERGFAKLRRILAKANLGDHF